jgi:hypothetical protein
LQAKRARNNEAVKRSREKAKEKASETTGKVNNLKNENQMLEQKVKLLSKELDVLKNIFLDHAGEIKQQHSRDLNSRNGCYVSANIYSADINC